MLLAAVAVCDLIPRSLIFLLFFYIVISRVGTLPVRPADIATVSKVYFNDDECASNSRSESTSYISVSKYCLDIFYNDIILMFPNAERWG